MFAWLISWLEGDGHKEEIIADAHRGLRVAVHRHTCADLDAAEKSELQQKRTNGLINLAEDALATIKREEANGKE